MCMFKWTRNILLYQKQTEAIFLKDFSLFEGLDKAIMNADNHQFFEGNPWLFYFVFISTFDIPAM